MPSRLSRVAALALSVLMLLTLVPFRAAADEGMFLPDAISQLPFDTFAKRGLKLKPTDLYDPNGVSIKDAVVIVGGGTGEFVSPEGLLLTNHHVAFDALVSASTPANDYGTVGFTAKTREEELPAQGYTVTITQALKDVTSEVTAGIAETATPQERNRAITTKIEAMEEGGAKPAEGITVRVLPMNEGLIYYSFTYLTLPDVRIVYAPPKNIGFYGGDPDNFEWPRHCGDFTFMRAYVGADGKPAEYSKTNVPYKPKKFLPLSMEGVKENDFLMVMGYPGSTRRYRESYSVAYNQDIYMPFLVDMYNYRIETLRNMGKNDPELRVKLQSDIFGLSNDLKNYEGSVVAMRRAGIVEQKRAEEAAFTNWVNADPARKSKYGEVLPALEKAYQELTATAQRDQIIQQIFTATDLLGIAFFAQGAAADKEKPEGERNPFFAPERIQRIRTQVSGALANRNPTSERLFLQYLLQKAAELPAGQKIDVLEKRFGNLQGDARRRAEEDFARTIVDSQRFSKPEGVVNLFDLTSAQLRELKEPLLEFASELGAEFQQIQLRTQTFNAAVGRWRPLLLKGMTEMKGAKLFYPDANRTLRFTYGEVKGYVPRDAALYLPFTSLSGVVEKDTGREPFDAPDRLKQLYRSKDFGPYATANGRDVPVDFLSTNDIIGGNSGSPVLNGRGEQVGIVFDGNYEGLGNDFFYNDEKGRTISVDIRYVLFVTDKFGGAGYILKELDIKGARSAAAGHGR
ncbi:MAG TPA: S46 family peptidase [Pyrinomonadaceae bacterium]|nr:S46 family peptidase [Pyrinomonadaceae bacterium]